MTHRWTRLIWMVVAALAITGCNLSAASNDAGTDAGFYSVDQVFKDPKARELAAAAGRGDAAEVQRLMKQEHVNPDVIFADDDSGMPLVAWPVFTNNPAGLKALLDNGANPNARNPEQHTEHGSDGSVDTFYNYDNAMVWAAKQDDPIYLKLLLDHGGDPNTRNANNEDLLFQAFIWHRQWKNVQVLVEHGADVNAHTSGMSILGEFTMSGGFEQAYWLFQHGADPKSSGDIDPIPPSVEPRYMSVEDIFWYPTDPERMDWLDWQRKCQQWLLSHGYKRPPLPKDYRDMRKTFGLPYEEKDIPLL